MKKLFLTFLFVILSSNLAQAIDWVELKSLSGNAIELDKDSIFETENHYFYNVKMNEKHTVITMQSQKNRALCARINYYKIDEYNSLNGDYENITKNSATDFEAVTFESRAYAAHKKVKQLMNEKNKPEITF